MPEKLALCIGINAYSGAQLYGCVNDARDWADLLTRQGWEVVQILLDAEATQDAIQNAVTSLVLYLGRRDQAVITYSGHGTWVLDSKGDEPDSRDEAIVPVDFKLILDDWLYETFAHAHPESQTVFISDSCFSGTVTRMAQTSNDTAPRVRFLPPAFFLGDKQAESMARDIPATVGPTRTAKKDIPTALTLSASTDSEYSYDAWFYGRANGALTRYAIDAFQQGMTYSQWHSAIRKRLPSNSYPQTPQLTGVYVQKRWRALA